MQASMQKVLSTALLLGLSLALVGCASTPRAEYDPGVDFADYRTFAWAAPDRREVRDPVLDSGLLDRRVEQAVREFLIERGYEEVDVEEADFLVTYHTTARDRIMRSSNVKVSLAYGRGYHYHPFWYDPRFHHGPYPYHHRTEDRSYREGTLIIDIVDREREELIWRSWRTAEARQERFGPGEIHSMVRRILHNFPPS